MFEPKFSKESLESYRAKFYNSIEVITRYLKCLRWSDDVMYLGISMVIVGYLYKGINRIKQLEVKVKEASANIDVALQKRYFVISQLLEVAKGYVKYEKEVNECD